MNTPLSYTVESALEASNANLQLLSEALFSNIADRLEEGVSSHSKRPLKVLSEQLFKLFQMHFRKVHPRVRDAVRAKESAPTEVMQAYKLGQLAFAQLCAAQAQEHRADDVFMEYLRQSSLVLYFKALLEREMTSQELATETGNQPETVSRKLKQLREVGIADFRKDGRQVFNFLTPVARGALETLPEFNFVAHTGTRENIEARRIVERKNQLRSDLSLHLQTNMIFGL